MSLDDSNLSPEPTVGQAAAQRFRYPAAQLVANWNWKSALFSVLNRGSIFLITTLKRGAFERSVAVGVEMVFAAIAAGIYSAFIQSLRFAKPRWLANLIVGAGLPGVLLLLDYLAHRYTGMRHMQASIIFLGFWSSFASLFNLFIMRRGVWLVGKQSGPLWRDLVRMPVLIGTFVAVGPRWLWNRIVGAERRSLEQLGEIHCRESLCLGVLEFDQNSGDRNCSSGVNTET
ncbi:MAG TPA: hypothetical protein VFB24_02530 [Candidatus Binatia bacterium]|nr:hypothetical protein [Candidatus Binatia bacterium]